MQLQTDLSDLVAQFLASGGQVQKIAPQTIAPIKSKHHRFEPDAPPHPLTPKVIAMHRQGMQMKAIRLALRMDHRTIVRILRSEGIDHLEHAPCRPPTPDQLRQLKMLARCGMTKSEAAREMGIGRGKLRSWIDRFHIRFGG